MADLEGVGKFAFVPELDGSVCSSRDEDTGVVGVEANSRGSCSR